MFAGPPKLHLVVEVRRFDDERVAFEPAAGIALPVANTVWDVRTAVERNDANGPAHLGVDDDMGWCLDDLVVAVVADTWQERGPPTPNQRQRSPRPRFRVSVAPCFPLRVACVGPFAGGSSQWRDAAGGSDDQ